MAVTRVLIHAGFHKTGTSSVQKALAAGRAGWAPHLRIALGEDLGPLPSAARNWTRAPSSGGLKRLRLAAREAFASFAPDDPRPIVISSEDLAGTLPGRGAAQDYAAVPDLMEILNEALQARIEAQLTLMFTTRAADPWLRSLWWQHLRVLRFETAEEQFCRDYAAAADFAPILSATRARLPEARVEAFALETISGMQAGPVTPLLLWAGLPPDAWGAAPERSNTRPKHGIDQVFLALNRSGLPDAYVQDCKRKLLRKARRMGL